MSDIHSNKTDRVKCLAVALTKMCNCCNRNCLDRISTIS